MDTRKLRRIFAFVQVALPLSILRLAAQQEPVASIMVDYPAEESIFPPDMVAPTFLWRDPDKRAGTWRIDVTFDDGSAGVQVRSAGKPLQIGEIDERCISETNKLPELTPQQAEAHTWKRDAATWAAIKRQSVWAKRR